MDKQQLVSSKISSAYAVENRVGGAGSNGAFIEDNRYKKVFQKKDSIQLMSCGEWGSQICSGDVTNGDDNAIQLKNNNITVQRVLTGEQIIKLLKLKAGSEPGLTEEEEKEILSFLKSALRSGREAREIKFLLRSVLLNEKGELFRYLYPGAVKAPQKKKTLKRKKPGDGFDDPVYDDSESDFSESGEVDLEKWQREAPSAFTPSMRHSRQGQPPNYIDASNTNMTVFRDGAIIPRTTGAGSVFNAKAHRKKKTAIKLRLKSDDEKLRSLQESYHWGSHLPVEQSNDFESAKKRWRQAMTAEEHADIHKLLNRTMPGFSQQNAHTHAEQSFLRSEAWKAIEQKLIEEIKKISASFAVSESGRQVTKISMVLNRSSCIECARAMVVSTIGFWQKVANALKLASWHAAMQYYKDYIKFIVRFPTIYEHTRERASEFKNLDAILKGLIAAGWTIEPFAPVEISGKASYDDLMSRLKLANPSAVDAKTKKGDSGTATGVQIPLPGMARINPAALQAFLNSIAPGWSDALPERARMPLARPVAPNAGYMAGQIASAHLRELAPDLSRDREQGNLGAHQLRVHANSGKGAWCFIFSIIMGLTGESEQAVTEMVKYVARMADAEEGWIAADSETARKIIAIIERIYGVQIDLVVVQQGDEGPVISARTGHLGAHTVVIRQTREHYDAYIP